MPASSNAFPVSISPFQLDQWIGTPDCPVIVDTCLEADFAADPTLIPTALRLSHQDLQRLAAYVAGRPAVIICQKGRKLSQGVASWLRAQGTAAAYLQGGMMDWAALPGALRLPARSLPEPVDGSTLWVARQDPGIDLLACLWMIRRFIDRDARILFTEPDQVTDAATLFGATLVGTTEKETSGNFTNMQNRFALRSPALDQLARWIGDDMETPPQRQGALRRLFDGLSLQFACDHARLEVALKIFDALYHSARDGYDMGQTAPTNEG